MDSPGFDPSDPQEDGTPSQSRKRKATGASGRGVASLTPDQLAKKRANDREAQRAIRERTKNTIETLERKIHELTSQQPYQELQSIIRQRDAIQAENEEIRRRLASVMSIIQPLMGAQGLADLASAAQHNIQPGLGQPTSVFQPEQYMNGGPPPRSYPGQSTPGPQAHTDQSSYPSPFPSSDPDPASEAHSWANQRLALNNQRESLHRSHELSENGERLNFSFLIDSSTANKNTYIPSIPDRRSSPNDRPLPHSFPDSTTTHQAWNMLPKNCLPTCPLDSILLNFLEVRQRETASQPPGAGQTPTYISPAYPSISNLLNPTNTTTSAGRASPGLSRHIPSHTSNPTRPSSRQSDPISTLMTDIISKFPNISGLPEQVATTFIMFMQMRWQIHPTQENYERLPDWITPRPSQLFTAHPAWIDHLPWPRMRDKLVQNYQDYPFENWFLPFTSGLSVNWPYEAVDCLISPGEHEDPIINPVFERHIRRLENWSLGPQFAAAFPALADTGNVRDRKQGPLVNTPFGADQMLQGLSGIGAGMSLPFQQGVQHAPSTQQRQGTGSGSDTGG
ncbi:hypothetical protein H2198_000488 [Neophaeococcomyces mojaviensis]|uniref:Uncharacterized protein n=1 Tax=Neophaeococcomyces mojaviensis TaxID=3383035 RepID=A0ACC3AK21_9EURO|nr:hypothetical protein H2198_000488 [Knufia sp. JES_112]